MATKPSFIAAVILIAGCVIGLTDESVLGESVVGSGDKIVKTACVQCHRIEGKPAARRTKQAPDLIWAGNKYRSEWLISWLQNPEFKHYPVGYDFRPEPKKRHLVLPADQAKAVAEFLATRK